MKKWARSLALIGAFLQLSGFVGLLTTWHRFAEAQGMLDLSAPDVDRVTLSLGAMTQKLGSATDLFLLGLGAALLGIIFFIIAIMGGRYRRPWAFWFACVYGGLLMLIFPLGTLAGLNLLIYALSHRREFGRQVSVPAVAAV